MQHPPYVAVSGPSAPEDPALLELAFEAGAELAGRGWVVVTGGLGGVMAAAASGVSSRGGTAVALLPGSRRGDASEGHTVALPTGLGEMRNALLVRSVDAVLAVGGSWGTLSEVALAVRTGVPVVMLAGWELPGDVRSAVAACGTVGEAVTALAGLLGGESR